MYASSTATNTAVADSGTTDAATEGKLTQSGQNFLTTVSVGDYAIITTTAGAYLNRMSAKVTAVDSDTVLSVTGPGLPATGTGGLSASGTAYSIVAAADIYKCDLSTASFKSNVSVGDMVCNTTTNRNYLITAINSDTSVSIDWIGGVIAGDDFFILSDAGQHGYNLTRVDNLTMMRGNASNGEVTFHYKKLSSTNEKLAIAPGDTVTDDNWYATIKQAAEEAYASKWDNIAVQVPIVESSGTQGVQWAGTFTWS